MFKKLNRLFNYNKKFETVTNELYGLKNAILENRLSMGKLMSKQNLERTSQILKNIHHSEFKVFSQWGDDGIINFLINYLEIESKRFIEFGVESYTECNTRFLLVNDNWTGLIMDGSSSHINSVKNEDISWKFNLTAVAAFITAENINQVIEENDFNGEIGLLSIDIDGNDYWVWKAINIIKPVIVIIEYNSVFGSENPWTVPYKASFNRTEAHYTNLYYGSSLTALCNLSEEKGYTFIGCNSNGNNAYFVRNNKLKLLKPKTIAEGYVDANFAESRDESGNLTFIRDKRRLEKLKGMKIYNTQTNSIEII